MGCEVVIIDPLCFQAGCHKRRLNQALSVVTTDNVIITDNVIAADITLSVINAITLSVLLHYR